MGATSDDLMDIARAGAERIEMPENRVQLPELRRYRGAVRERVRRAARRAARDELFAPADVQRQEEIVQRLKELVDERTRSSSKSSSTTSRGRSG